MGRMCRHDCHLFFPHAAVTSGCQDTWRSASPSKKSLNDLTAEYATLLCLLYFVSFGRVNRLYYTILYYTILYYTILCYTRSGIKTKGIFSNEMGVHFLITWSAVVLIGHYVLHFHTL